MDSGILEHFKTAQKMFPKEARHYSSRLLGDMAWEWKAEAIKAIGSMYTIRNKRFVESKAFTVKRPNASTPIEQQEAIAASLRLEGGKYGLFTGWEEEIDGKPREMRGKSGGAREIWSPAREDGSVYGLALGKYKLGGSGDGYNSESLPDSSQYGLTARQFLAMLHKSLEEPRILSTRIEEKLSSAYITKKGVYKTRYKKVKVHTYSKPSKPLLGKNKKFIMEDGDKRPRGLYALIGGKVRALQKFHEKPAQNNHGKFDWRSEALGEVQKKFTPQYILENYITPALAKLWKK